jgi:hypothetical protein
VVLGLIALVIGLWLLATAIGSTDRWASRGGENPLPSESLALAEPTVHPRVTVAIETPNPTPTQIPTAEPTQDSRSLALREMVNTSTYIDLGGAADTEKYELNGFTTARISRHVCPIGGKNDTTKRDQLMNTALSSIEFMVVPDVPVTITMCVEKTTGLDRWHLSLHGDAVGMPGCTEVLASDPKPVQTTKQDMIVTDSIVIEARCVPTTRMMLAFTDRSNNGAGIWGILVQQNRDETSNKSDTARASEPTLPIAVTSLQPEPLWSRLVIP